MDVYIFCDENEPYRIPVVSHYYAGLDRGWEDGWIKKATLREVCDILLERETNMRQGDGWEPILWSPDLALFVKRPEDRKGYALVTRYSDEGISDQSYYTEAKIVGVPRHQ